MKTSDKIKQWLYSRLSKETDSDIIYFIRSEITMIKHMENETTDIDK